MYWIRLTSTSLNVSDIANQDYLGRVGFAPPTHIGVRKVFPHKSGNLMMLIQVPLLQRAADGMETDSSLSLGITVTDGARLDDPAFVFGGGPQAVGQAKIAKVGIGQHLRDYPGLTVGGQVRDPHGHPTLTMTYLFTSERGARLNREDILVATNWLSAITAEARNRHQIPVLNDPRHLGSIEKYLHPGSNKNVRKALTTTSGPRRRARPSKNSLKPVYTSPTKR